MCVVTKIYYTHLVYGELMIIAVTGYKGRLGSQLIHLGCVPLECNVTSNADVKTAVDLVKPDVIINCAAKTDVDACESTKGYKEALAVNFRGATNIQDVFDGHLIQISTDYVFNCLGGPYYEDFIKLDPINSYGFSKFGAEAGLTPTFSLGGSVTIVRTTGLYGGVSGKQDFVYKIIKSLTRKESIKVTNELYGNQTYIPHLAEALVKLASINKERDIVHVASEEVVNRYDFALMIANTFGLDSSFVVPCTNDEVGWKAKRPTLGGLYTEKASRYGLPIYSISDGLKDLKENGLKYYEIRNHSSIL